MRNINGELSKNYYDYDYCCYCCFYFVIVVFLKFIYLFIYFLHVKAVDYKYELSSYYSRATKVHILRENNIKLLKF